MRFLSKIRSVVNTISSNTKIESGFQTINEADGQVSIRIEGALNDGTTIDEHYIADQYFNEEIEHSSSYLIQNQSDSRSSVNILRFSDKKKTAQIFIRFCFNGLQTSEEDIRVETRRWLGKHRMLHSTYYLDESNDSAKSPIYDLVFDQSKLQIRGSYSYSPAENAKVLISGVFNVYLKNYYFKNPNRTLVKTNPTPF
jgi:hypothetical protein